MALGLEDIRAALASANADGPKGAIEDDATRYQIYADDSDPRGAISRSGGRLRNGAPIRLSDVADVENLVEDLRNAGLVNGEPGVAVILSRQRGANIVRRSTGSRRSCRVFIARCPGDIDLTVAVDRSRPSGDRCTTPKRRW